MTNKAYSNIREAISDARNLRDGDFCAPRGTNRLAPTVQPRKPSAKDLRHAAARKPGGRALRVLASMFGGAL